MSKVSTQTQNLRAEPAIIPFYLVYISVLQL
jgi:hypothetical protein